MISRRLILCQQEEEQQQQQFPSEGQALQQQAAKRVSRQNSQAPAEDSSPSKADKMSPKQATSKQSYADDHFFFERHRQQQAHRLALDSQPELSSNFYNSFQNNHPAGAMQHQQEPEDNYRHFDPYSVHGEEDEDVWYSEERLFEDHLEEIFNKWRLLDDDIWCKLIIMERNRRIGKAYARVPIVTIDGSHELSYDGYKLALNGFENPDRDSMTEECRKRIGKGFRIKMDNLGNIVIKRLSKSGVYVKDWSQLELTQNVSPTNNNNNNNNTNHPNQMPSRRQLIRNQLAASGIITSNSSSSSSGSNSTIQTNSSNSSHNKKQPAGSSNGTSSGSSSMLEAANDTAVCDELISLGGCLALNQFFYLFDMKKFQSNITQELCRPYPDIRKLEQQCFSIIGLVRDSEEMLNLPVWVMVINIVAIEMLNERFPLMMSQYQQRSSFPDTILHEQQQQQLQKSRSRAQPSFVNIFEQNNNHSKKLPGSGSGSNSSGSQSKAEEDPYSLPANVSSSDVKSSINDNYGTSSTRNISSSTSSSNNHHHRYYSAAGKEAHPQLMSYHRKPLREQLLSRDHRSKSNCNIYGNGNGGKSIAADGQGGLASQHSRLTADKYNQSIYSPGHMLVPPPVADLQLPPKLPPRDFVGKKMSLKSSNAKSKSSSNVNQEEIYSAAADLKEVNMEENSSKARKSKKNRFLDSLKAPLELAKSSGNRSASVLGAPLESKQQKSAKQPSSASSTTSFAKAGLRSLLGGKKKSPPEGASDDSNYIHLDNSIAVAKKRADEVDSVVDSSEEMGPVEGERARRLPNQANGYNDLDIPTPDYETDENIYHASGYKQCELGKTAQRNLGSGKKSPKDDLYYSGFSAHIPQTTAVATGGKSVSRSQVLSKQRSTASNGAQMEPLGGGQVRAGSRFGMSKLHKQLAAKSRPGEPIYGSSSGLSAANNGDQQTGGARFRSASMQRNYHMRGLLAGSQTEVAYDGNLEPELLQDSPHAISSGNQSYQKQHGRAGSRSNKTSMLSQPIYGTNYQLSSAKMLATNYDIGRSSSGIYGNNSSSSSSDYADWHPQMRKVNSSGYLNSIFKSHHQQANSNNPLDFYTLDHNNKKFNNQPNYSNNTKQRSYTTSRALKASNAGNGLPPSGTGTTGRPPSSGALLAGNKQRRSQAHKMLIPLPKPINSLSGPAYRSYDSSNDSEPSYTNSSDGLDIYDQIESRLNHNNQFLGDLLPGSANGHNLNAPEVHVGEWEDMYSR